MIVAHYSIIWKKTYRKEDIKEILKTVIKKGGGTVLSNKTVKEELCNYIMEFGVMQKHIAEKIGVSPTTINLFLKGERELSQSKLEAIALLIM